MDRGPRRSSPSAVSIRRLRSTSTRPDRGGVHPEAFLGTWSGIMQADAYAGFNRLYEPARLPGTIIEAGCWAHWRRKFYEIAVLKEAPLAVEAVTRIDAIFAIERTINGSMPSERQDVREQTIRPLVDALVVWLIGQRAALSSKSETAKAMDYGLKRLPAFTRFLHDGRVCLSNNAAERAMRCIAIGRKNWTFRRLGRWWPPRRGDLHPDRDLQAQRRRSPRLARGCPQAPAGPPRQAHPRASAVELVARDRNRSRRLSKPVLVSSETYKAVFTGCFRGGAGHATRR